MAIEHAKRRKRPSNEELTAAVEIAKGPPYNFKSTDIKHGDEGAAVVRNMLAEEFRTMPLSQIRKWCENLSRAGGEPGPNKRTPEQRIASGIKSLLALFPRSDEHSREYIELHASMEYKLLRDSLKRRVDYCCQGCTRGFVAEQLEGHILNYDKWTEPGQVLIVCGECHQVLDALRRRGRAIERKQTADQPLF